MYINKKTKKKSEKKSNAKISCHSKNNVKFLKRKNYPNVENMKIISQMHNHYYECEILFFPGRKIVEV